MGVIEPNFIEQVANITGDSIYRCYQCQKCSSGCPSAEFMDHLPAEIIRLIQLGYKGKVLSSTTIWVCSSCETCTTRCPNEVDIAMTMDVMREMCVKSSHKISEKNAVHLHRSFLSSIRRYGKVHELGMMIGFILKSKKYFSFLFLGFNMFRKGKIKILPHKITRIKEIRKILEKY